MKKAQNLIEVSLILLLVVAVSLTLWPIFNNSKMKLAGMSTTTLTQAGTLNKLRSEAMKLASSMGLTISNNNDDIHTVLNKVKDKIDELENNPGSDASTIRGYNDQYTTITNELALLESSSQGGQSGSSAVGGYLTASNDGNAPGNGGGSGSSGGTDAGGSTGNVPGGSSATGSTNGSIVGSSGNGSGNGSGTGNGSGGGTDAGGSTGNNTGSGLNAIASAVNAIGTAIISATSPGGTSGTGGTLVAPPPPSRTTSPTTAYAPPPPSRTNGGHGGNNYGNDEVETNGGAALSTGN